jgi:hypothetical protein
MIPWLVLDRGFSERDAVALAMKIGMHSPELLAAALEYLRDQRAGAV